MPFDFVRKLLSTGPRPERDAAPLRTASAEVPVAVEGLLIDLAQRVPADLAEPFQGAMASRQSRPTTALGLLDDLHQAHLGLGIAIGRGDTGQGPRYEQLGRVVLWLYEELGRPQHSQFAIVERAAAAAAARREAQAAASPAGPRSPS